MAKRNQRGSCLKTQVAAIARREQKCHNRIRKLLSYGVLVENRLRASGDSACLSGFAGSSWGREPLLLSGSLDALSVSASLWAKHFVD